MQQFLDRYLAGDYVLVWDELRRLSAERAALTPDVKAVCREMMRRVRTNLETIVSHLNTSGYEFHDPYAEDSAPLVSPTPDAGQLIQRLIATIGPLPLSVQAFMTVVGDVCLLGNHPNWGINYPPKGPSLFVSIANLLSVTPEPSDETVIWYPDPLVVEFRYSRNMLSFDQVMLHYKEINNPEDGGPPGLEFSADAVHKAGYSGGSPYCVHLPDGGADGTVSLDVKGDMYFVDYLRHAILNWGGFPGFESAPAGRDCGLIAELKRGLIPF